MNEPILLLPQTFVWSHLPGKRRRGLTDMFFGPVEWPGKVRVFFQFLFNFRNALLRSGQPFDLMAFMEDHVDLTDSQIADKVRYAMLRIMERERTLVLGPTQKTPGRIQEELVRSPRVRKHIEAQARSTSKSIAKVERLARKDLRRLCANQTPYMLAFLNRVLHFIFRRIYDGVVVDKEGVDRVRDAAREGTLIYLPSHKSHIDYLVLSHVLYQHALACPLIAAGENLNFFPAGFVLRRGGAFFIKRTFKGKKLYAALVDAYLRKLILEGFPVEFFIEGGRSRTGKLLSPKYGLLSMVIDAALKLRMKKVFFVPLSIGYERIIEERSYVHELGGGEKQKENVGGLLKAPKILRSKYGRLYVQFGKIISFEEALSGVTGSADRSAIKPPQRRALVRRIAHETTYQIDRVTMVTPAALVATALLVHRRRGMTRVELRARCEMLIRALTDRGARVAGAIVEDSGRLRMETLEQAIALFLDAGLVKEAEAGGEPIYRVPDQRRMALEYYKNNLLHFFASSALIAAALRASDEQPVSTENLKAAVHALAQLFRHEFNEFNFRGDEAFDRSFEQALFVMVDSGEVVRDDGRIRSADGERGRNVDVYADMLRTSFESTLLTLRSCAARLATTREVSRKDWLRRALGLGQRMYLAGELDLRESISKHKLEAALRSLKDLKLLSFKEAGFSLAPEVSVEDLRQREKEVARHLR